MPLVTRIENAGPDQKARRLFFSDHENYRVTSAAAVRALDIQEGSQVDLTELATVELTAARDRALRLLGYRDRSQSELAKRLSNDGYPPECVSQTVSRLIEIELVDDARFARSWSRSRTAAGFGPSRIRRELSQKGLDAETIASALEEMGDQGDEHKRAVACLRGRIPRDAKERERLIRRLVTRGFSLSTALNAVPSVGSEPEMDPDN